MADDGSGEKPLFEVKPVFYFSVVFLRYLPLIIFMSIFLTGFLAVVMVFITEGLPNMLGTGGGGEYHGGVISIMEFMIITFAATCLIFRYAAGQAYRKSVYKFYSDRVEFNEGFFTITKKSVEYSKILEVTMTSGILQRPKNLGSFSLLTAATTGRDRQGGITIADIEGPDERYARIRQIVQGGKK